MSTHNIKQQPLTPEKAALLGNILRAMGGLFILAGMVLALDLGGVATAIGFNDGTEHSVHQLLGCLIAVMGLVDFFVLPVVFKKMADKNTDQAL